MHTTHTDLLAVIAGDWKAQDGSVVFIDHTGRVEKNHNPFPVQISICTQSQYTFNGFVGELVSPDVILWRSETEDVFTLWTRQGGLESGDSSSAFDSNANYYDSNLQTQLTENSILEHAAYRRAVHRHRTFAAVPAWVPFVLDLTLGGIFRKIRLSKFGFVRLEYKDIVDQHKTHTVNAPVDFFQTASNEFTVNLAVSDLSIAPLFPFRQVSINVTTGQEESKIRHVRALVAPTVLESYRFGAPLKISDSMQLRELGVGDAGELFATVQASSHLDRFLSNFVKETGSSVARCRWALEAWQRGSRQGHSLHLGLVEGTKVLGLVHIDKNLIGCHSLAVVEYWLGKGATGRGLAPVMVIAALQWARESLKVDMAHFDVHPDNEGSIKVLQKLGAKLQKHKKKSKDEKIFHAYRLVLDDAWSLLAAARRPWLSSHKRLDASLHSKVSLSVATDRISDFSFNDAREVKHHRSTPRRRHSLSHVTYFGRDPIAVDCPGSLAHRMRIPVTGPRIALRQVVGASSGAGSWFVVFIKEFDWNSPVKDAILSLRNFWPGEGYYFGLENVASVVDLNQCDSSDQRESLVSRFKLDVDALPQGRLLVGGQIIPYHGSLSDIGAITAFFNTTRKSPLVSNI